jgi:hypothetical protein
VSKKVILSFLSLFLSAFLLNNTVQLASSFQPLSNPNLPAYPTVLKDQFILGLANQPGDISWMTGSGIAWDARYQYLSGGVNTGGGWSTWWPGAGGFALDYMNNSYNSGYFPVLTYYNLLQSLPATGATEYLKDYNNLNNPGTMAAYFADFKLLMDKAKIFNKPVIVHVEPDFWGYMEIRNANPAAIPASVTSSGYGPVAGYANNVAGFAQALVALRNTYAPNVLLAFHVSPWSSPQGDVASSSDPGFAVQNAAQNTANFYNSLGANFDLMFYDIADRDAAYYQIVMSDASRWWDVNNATYPNFNRFNQFALAVTNATGKRGMLWQVPIGNYVYRSVNNTSGHYQDNRVQYYLGGGNNQHLQDLADSGIIGVLFGAGSGETTTYNDGQGDGVTNPAPIDGNNGVATFSDDDGGYLRYMGQAYYGRGAVILRMNAPSNLQTTTPLNATQIGLSWSQTSTNETGFSIEARIGPSGNWYQIGTVGANVTAYTASGLLNGTQYYFRIRAFANGFYSAYSNTTNPVTTTLPAPTGLTATAARSTQINLSWTDNSNSEQLFRIQRRIGVGAFADLATVGTNVTTYSDTNVSANTAYSYQVRAETPYAQSSYVALASNITTPPSEPSNLTATTVSGTQINLAWISNSGSIESGFHLDWKKLGDTNWTTINIGQNVTSYNNTGLLQGTVYYYRVRAYGTGGDSANSNEASAVTTGGLVVSAASDDGTGGPNTLSKAFQDAAGAPNKTITFNLASPYTITVTGALPAMPAGVTLGGFCTSAGPGITITASNPNNLAGLQLPGNTIIYGIRFYGFQGPPQQPGPQLKIIAGAGGNKFSCTKFG